MTMKCTKYFFQSILVLLSACMTNVYADAVNDGVKVKWGYVGNTGPARWGQLDPAYELCATGKTQSPINISKKFKTAPHALEIKYQPAPMVILNDGVTDLLIGQTKTITNTGHGIQLNFPEKGVRETITFKGVNYHLVQFHIHTPSETAFNNQIYPMEIHFVHQNDDGQVAVIAVLGKTGETNTELQNIIDHLPAERGVEVKVSNDKINPAVLIPSSHDYYNFAGSLTTPPCTEGLQWIVMRDFITVSSVQNVLLRKAIGGDNSRPLQRDNKRDIYFSVG